MKTTTMPDFDINADYKRRLARLHDEIHKRDLLIGDLGETLGAHKQWIAEAESRLESVIGYIDALPTCNAAQCHKHLKACREISYDGIKATLKTSPNNPLQPKRNI